MLIKPSLPVIFIEYRDYKTLVHDVKNYLTLTPSVTKTRYKSFYRHMQDERFDLTKLSKKFRLLQGSFPHLYAIHLLTYNRYYNIQRYRVQIYDDGFYYEN